MCGIRSPDLVGILRPETITIALLLPVPEPGQRDTRHDGDDGEGETPQRRDDDEEPADLARAAVVLEQPQILRQEAELSEDGGYRVG